MAGSEGCRRAPIGPISAVISLPHGRTNGKGRFGAAEILSIFPRLPLRDCARRAACLPWASGGEETRGRRVAWETAYRGRSGVVIRCRRGIPQPVYVHA